MMQPNAGGIAAISPQATQQPMPGQANPQAIQGILQQGQGAGPPPQGGRGGIGMPLSQVPIEVLYAAAQGQSQDILPYQAISELQDRIKKQKMQQAMQGQQAMAMNAQQAQKPPVAQEILEEGRQLAKLDQGIGASEYGFADGGIVAFSNGGQSKVGFGGSLGTPSEETVLRLEQAANTPGIPPEERQMLLKQAADMLETLVRQGVPLTKITSRGTGMPIENVRTAGAQDPGAPPMAPPMPSAQPPAPPAPPPAAPYSPQQDISREVANLNTRSPRTMQRQAREDLMGMPYITLPDPEEDIEAYRQAVENRTSAMRTRGGLTEEQLFDRRQIEEAAARNLAAREAANKEDWTETESALKERMKRTPFFDSAEGVLKVAGKIDPRRGQGIRTAAAAIGEELGKQRADREAAQKEYRQALRDKRNADLALSEAQLLEVRRKAALRDGDIATANALQERIEQLEDSVRKYGVERKDKAFQQRRELEATKTSRLQSIISADRGTTAADGKQRLTPETIRKLEAEAREDVIKLIKERPQILAGIPKDRHEAEIKRMIQEAYSDSVRRLKDMGYDVPDTALRGATSSASTQPSGSKSIKWNSIP